MAKKQKYLQHDLTLIKAQICDFNAGGGGGQGIWKIVLTAKNILATLLARAVKHVLENLNTRKNTSRRILTVILLKNSELKLKFKPKFSVRGVLDR